MRQIISLLRTRLPTCSYYAQMSSKTPSREGNPSKQSKIIKEKTPVGEFDKNGNEEEAPKRRIVNPETGEIGGPQGPEPTRYGDWERKGRVSDF